VTLGIGEGQELRQFLVGLESVRGEVVQRPDRPSFLAASNCATDKRGRTTTPAELSAPEVLTETSNGYRARLLSSIGGVDASAPIPTRAIPAPYA
jgi:hypothetical protein